MPLPTPLPMLPSDVAVLESGRRPAGDRVPCPRPLALSPVCAGFPSPADDHVDRHLDLNDYCIDHPAATFFVRVQGESMRGAGIFPGDLLVVDRAVEPASGRVVIAVLEGEFTCKRLRREGDGLRLLAEHPDYAPIVIHPEMDFEIWGVVTHVVRRV